jgi:hypothetical protein
MNLPGTLMIFGMVLKVFAINGLESKHFILLEFLIFDPRRRDRWAGGLEARKAQVFRCWDFI